jgi:hypothetical protein
MGDAELVQRAKLLLDQLCEKPRFAGGSGEARARIICREELERAGFHCRPLPFDYSQWPARWGPPLSAALQAATIIITARIALESDPLSALVTGGALIAALFLVDAYARRRWITNFPAQRARSVNLEATRGTPKVWFVAHLDSKSQTVPMLVRIAGSVALAAVVALTLAGLLISLIGVQVSGGIWRALELAAIAAAIPGVSCFVRNDSMGAVDNASGVVAAILASQSAVSPRDLGILITSAEELGLAGARAWAEAAPKGGLFLNCDTVDDTGDWRCMHSGGRPQRITNATVSVADRLRTPIRVTRLIPGILADNMAFADRGMQAVTLSRGTLSTLARIHTRRDTSNGLTGRGSAEASILLSALAKELS